MPEFNPNSPAISGLEWYPVRRLPRPLKTGSGTGVTLVSTATESVDAIVPWVASPDGAVVGCDVYDAASVVAPVVGGLDVPGVDIASTAGIQSTDDNGVTWVDYTTGIGFVDLAAIDTYSPATLAFLIDGIGKWLRYNPTGSQGSGHLTWQGTGSYVKVTDGLAGNDPSSSRPGWIEINIVAKAHNGASATIDSIVRTASGTDHGSDEGPRRITSKWARYTFHHYWNGDSGAQWFNSEIAQFLSGGTNSWGVAFRGKAPTEYWIGAVNIVWRSCAELRLATGDGHTSSGAYMSIPMLDPTDGSSMSWAKASGTSYLLSFYLPGLPGSATLNGIDQGTLAEAPSGALGGWTGTDQPTASSIAGVSTVPSGTATESTWAPSVYLDITGTESVDSQPYVTSRVMRVSDADALGDDAQLLPAHSTADYAMARFVVGMFAADGLPTPPPDDVLIVQLTDNAFAPVGGTIAVAPGDVPTDSRWHLISDRLSSAASLASGSDYYLCFTTASTIPWTVGVLDTLESTAAGPAIEAGGIVNGVSGTFDLLTNVGTVPPALTGLTTNVTTFEQSPAPGCGPVDIEAVALEWDTSALAADFGYYEVQRQSDGDGNWYTIATITDEGGNSYTDRECLRNLPEQYRIRVVRADGAQSDWTTGTEVTATTALGCDLIVATSTAVFAYGESGNTAPLHNFARANAQSTVTHLIAGRQAPVGFRPLIEGDSDVFQRTLVVNVDEPGANLAANDPGFLDRFPFDPLLALIEDTTQPYVTLCDGHGRRWFCFAEFVQGSYAPIGHAHVCDVKFTEVAVTPISHTITTVL